MFEKFNYYYDLLVDLEIATPAEISIALYFNGHTIKTLEEVLFFKADTNFEALLEELEEE